MAKTVEFLGGSKILRDLAILRERYMSPGVALEMEFDVLEAAEQELFDSYGGEYIRTGRLIESLTQRNARDAIREMHGPAIEFGTRTWYAVFQRTIGGPSGKPRGRKRIPPSKVLKLDEKSRQAALESLHEYIIGGLGMGSE